MMLSQHRPSGTFKQNKSAYVMCAFVLTSLLVAILGWTVLFRAFPSSDSPDSLSDTVITAAGDLKTLRTSDEKEVIADRISRLGTERDHGSMSDTEASIRERAKAAVLGAFVADAATMSLHWIYDANGIAALLEGTKDAAFFEPPSCPFYKAALGSFSPYGDEAFPTLKSVVEHSGVDGAVMTSDLAAAFSASKGYVNSASKALARNVQGGKTFPDASPPDDQAHSLVKVPIVVARYAGKPELKDKVIEATRSHQQGDTAQQFAVATAAILEQVVLGKDIAAAVDSVLSSADPAVRPFLKAAVDSPASDVAGIVKAIQGFNPSCHLPGSFQGPLVAALHTSSYADAVRANIVSGGDQASRAHVVGALWAAQDGRSAIPPEWAAKTTAFREVEALVDTLLSQRG